MQLNHISCKSTDSENDTENTISINVINVENDYETIMCEPQLYSHIYQNHDHFLSNYYTRPISKNTTNEKNTKIIQKIIEEKPIEFSSTNNIYQNKPKEPQVQKEKNMDNPTSFRKSKI